MRPDISADGQSSGASVIDARGLKCPLPVLKAEKRLRALDPGQSFTLIADDPVARVDVPLLCKKNGHACTIEREGNALAFTITKAG